MVGNMAIVQMVIDKGWNVKPIIWQYASDGDVDHLGRRLKANEACNCVLGDNINSQNRSNGDIINKATITAYPKKTDTSNQILYQLDSPMLLGSGETKTFKGRYTNPECYHQFIC